MDSAAGTLFITATITGILNGTFFLYFQRLFLAAVESRSHALGETLYDTNILNLQSHFCK
jgi:hypothetical protein